MKRMKAPLPLRIITSRPHLFSGAVIGLISFFPLSLIHETAIRAILAFDIGSFIFLALTFASFASTKERDISKVAMRQQEGEWSVFALTILGAVMSFTSIFLFSGAPSSHKEEKGLYLAFVVTTLLLSWLTTHVSFAYRYAHEYYTVDAECGPEGGLAFPNDDKPDYLDFIYFSFVLGMTFQVSDVNITSKKFRRLATIQGLIGFLFNTVILALSVNIAASLL
jgi:uncharacterized membrane protein